MEKVKKIVLITNASNFERQKKVVHAVHEELKRLGNYALYVLSNYGIFVYHSPYNVGAESIYQLIEQHDFDGCILDSNVAHSAIYKKLANILHNAKIPFVTMNFAMENEPFIMMDVNALLTTLVEHLIIEHHCTRINMVGFDGEDIFSNQGILAYKDTLERNGIPYEERRVVYQTVSVTNGRNLFHIFQERGIDDAQATICIHDVLAMGYCLELEERGFSVSEDMKICSIHYSTNSMVFRPEITGIDRQDDEIAKKACRILEDIMKGRSVSQANFHSGQICYAESCGCTRKHGENERKIHQDIILNKVEAGGQISRMMTFNDSIESVESLKELGNNVASMLQSEQNHEYIFCLNQRDIGYILNEGENLEIDIDKAYDDNMFVVTGNTCDRGRIDETTFDLKQLMPIKPKKDDIYIFMPIHRNDRVYGYITFINNYMPIDVYNHRICHESIGSSIEGLRRQMILRGSIKELDELHMHDALTGLYNRYAEERYAKRYIEPGAYTVVMMDMDGLKFINDTYGHLAGNNALNIMADALRDCVDMSDLLVRYAGDEFLIISHNTDCEYWDNFSDKINDTLTHYVELQKLPYKLGASVGYSICNSVEEEAFEECYRQADSNMYKNKQARKIGQKN